MNSDFENIKEMMLDTINTEKGRWYNNVNAYKEELGISWEDLFEMTSGELKKKIKEYDTRIWKENLAKKSTLKFYADGKTKIGYEFCYRNDSNSTYYARARINSLKLEEAIGRGNRHYNKKCKICGEEDEDLVHFIIKCKALEGKRDYNLIDRGIEDPEQRLIKLLFTQEDHQGVGRMVKGLWFRRKAIMLCKEKMEKSSNDRMLNPERVSRSDPGPMGNCQPPMRWKA